MLLGDVYESTICKDLMKRRARESLSGCMWRDVRNSMLLLRMEVQSLKENQRYSNHLKNVTILV